MSTHSIRSWASSPAASLLAVRLATLAAWLAVGGVAVYWGLKLLAWSTAAATAVAVTPPLPVADEASVARLLGAVPGPAPAAVAAPRSQLVLAGVVSRPQGGAALISVNGAPAQPFRPGQAVADGYAVGAIGTQQVTLVDAGQADWVLPMPQEFAAKAAAGAAAVPAARVPSRPAQATRVPQQRQQNRPQAGS